MNSELYDTLGVPTDASPEEIKAAHRRAVKSHHPDKGGNAEAFHAVQIAYDVLSDPERRARYDETGATDTTDRAARIESMAAERFGAMVAQAINDPFALRKDWIAEARRASRQDRARVEADMKGFTERRNMATNLSSRFKSKAPRNLPQDVIAHLVREFERLIEQGKEKIAVLDRFDELLKDYQFEADPEPPPTVPSSRSPYQNLNAGFFRL